jgi:hypothetical protein
MLTAWIGFDRFRSGTVHRERWTVGRGAINDQAIDDGAVER